MQSTKKLQQLPRNMTRHIARPSQVARHNERVWPLCMRKSDYPPLDQMQTELFTAALSVECLRGARVFFSLSNIYTVQHVRCSRIG